jgi:hypothetical protein
MQLISGRSFTIFRINFNKDVWHCEQPLDHNFQW